MFDPLEFYVAGVQFRPQEDIVAALSKFTTGELCCPTGVQLIGEPSNRYDRYAVKILLDGRHIGYVPKPKNVEVWAARDAAMKPKGVLVSYNTNVPPYEMFKVEVTFTKP